MIRHSHFLQRLSATEANKIVRFLEREVYPDLVERIRFSVERARTSGTKNMRSTKRLREVQKEIDAMIQAGHRTAYQRTRSVLRDATIVEARFAHKMLVDVVGKLDISLTMPSHPLLRAIVDDSVIRGEFLKDDFAAMTARTRRNVRSAINIGLTEGEGIDQITRRLRGSSINPGGVLASTGTDARRIVRTSVNHITTQARELTYGENEELVKGVRWVSTLDTKTSHVCIALDGSIHGVNDGPRPPAHANCRSTTTPILKSWKELGINLKEAPRGTRASMNGQVPAATTYPEWLKRQPTAIQNEVLGPRLAKEWRAGRVPVSKFIDNQNRALSLSDILRLEGLD